MSEVVSINFSRLLLPERVPQFLNFQALSFASRVDGVKVLKYLNLPRNIFKIPAEIYLINSIAG